MEKQLAIFVKKYLQKTASAGNYFLYFWLPFVVLSDYHKQSPFSYSFKFDNIYHPLIKMKNRPTNKTT